jgi:hypothetical protein
MGWHVQPIPRAFELSGSDQGAELHQLRQVTRGRRPGRLGDRRVFAHHELYFRDLYLMAVERAVGKLKQRPAQVDGARGGPRGLAELEDEEVIAGAGDPLTRGHVEEAQRIRRGLSA